MALPSVFNPSVTNQIIERINRISPETKPLWGKMNAGQMLAHCNVSYEYIFEPNKYKPASGFMKLILKFLVKKVVVNEKPYKQGSPTGPDFKIVGDKDFEAEKARLISFIKKTQELGAAYFDGKASQSFGNLTSIEWNNMFYKHLDHHLRQFGV